MSIHLIVGTDQCTIISQTLLPTCFTFWFFWHHCTWQDLPGLPPSYLHAGSSTGGSKGLQMGLNSIFTLWASYLSLCALWTMYIRIHTFSAEYLSAYLIILHLICCIFNPCLLCPLHKWPDTVYKDLCCQTVKKLLLPLLYNKRECLTLKCPRGKFISHCVAGHTHILQVVVGWGKGEPWIHYFCIFIKLNCESLSLRHCIQQVNVYMSNTSW